MTPTTPVRITVNPTDPFHSNITVDGHDITPHVNRYTISHKEGEVPTVVFEGYKLDVVFDGIAEVGILAQEVVVGQAAASFLDAMDHETVQRLVLDADQWLGLGLIPATLKVLADLARGGSGNFSPNRPT